MFEQKRILTIDDSSTIRTLLTNVLGNEGAEVEEAGDGKTALAMIASGKKYDLVLLDLLLPDTNGIEILKRLREDNDEMAVVILTGLGGVKSAIAASQMGADGYFEKQDLSGGDFSEFFYALARAFERRGGIVAQKQLQQVRTDFYSMVAHDLRSPISTLIVGFEMLLGPGGESFTAEQREILELSQMTGKKLLHLVNDYLDFAKIDAGYLKIEPADTDLNALVKESIQLTRLQAVARHQELVVTLPAEPLRAQVDADRFKQVLENLLSNAIKYTPEGGRITVELKAKGGEAEFRVIDTGKGLTPEQTPSLFSKYHRVPGEATRGISGTGLGLLIVKEIVQAHGGEVSAESAGVKKGATFIVSVPLKRKR